jgi:hypothetical protein
MNKMPYYSWFKPCVFDPIDRIIYIRPMTVAIYDERKSKYTEN